MVMNSRLMLRYHVNALTIQLENNYFKDEAISDVQLFLRKLKKQKEKATKNTKKEKSPGKQKQTNISCHHSSIAHFLRHLSLKKDMIASLAATSSSSLLKNLIYRVDVFV